VVETLALMLSVSVVVVPLEILRASHAAGSVILHVNVPPIGFDSVIDFASGGGPPATPEKFRLVGLSNMLGVTAVVPPVTTSLTGTDCNLCSLLIVNGDADCPIIGTRDHPSCVDLDNNLILLACDRS
jgi:hypothetical protein